MTANYTQRLLGVMPEVASMVGARGYAMSLASIGTEGETFEWETD
jgi:hypothetical protein